MRTQTIIPTNLNDEQIREALGRYMTDCGYVFQNYKGMQVWKRGNGWVTAPMIFKVDRNGNNLIIESWIPFALLPGVYFGESGLDSAFGFAIKIGMRDILKDIVGMTLAQGQNISGYYPNK